MEEQARKTTDDSKTLSNDRVTVRVTQRPGCRFDMHVSVTAEATQACFEKACKEIRKEVSLPGFRKGKVPQDLLQKHFKDTIDERFRNIVSTTAFHEAAKLNGRPPLSNYSLIKNAIDTISCQEGATLRFLYEAAPEVPHVEPDKLTLKHIEPKTIEQSDIDKAHARHQFLFSEKTPVTDRPIQENDLVSLSFFNPDNKDEKEKETLPMSKLMLPDWLHSAIMGMSIGEEKIVCRSNEEDRIGILIEAIQECELLPLEEVAKKINFSSLEEMTAFTQEAFHTSAKEQAQEQMRKQIRNELIRLYAFDLPQSLVEQETQARLRSFKERNQELRHDEKTVRQSILDEVKRYLTCYFLLQPVAQELHIVPSEEQITRELYLQNYTTAETERVLHSALSEREIFYRLFSVVMIKSVLDYYIRKLSTVEPSANT